MSSKGQIWSADFVAGIATFMFMLLLLALAWKMLDLRWHHASEYRQMQTDALFASEALMVSAGDPPSWDRLAAINESRSIGLVDSRNVLSARKIARLAAENQTSYYEVKERLGIQRYELGIRVMDLRREVTLAEFGRFPQNISDSVVLERMGLLEGDPVIMRMEVWK